MEGSFETSYLLSPQQFDGVEGRNGKTATPVLGKERVREEM
jgi:hypothetical protein